MDAAILLVVQWMLQYYWLLIDRKWCNWKWTWCFKVLESSIRLSCPHIGKRSKKS